MRAVLQAISDELLRLKAEGETTVPVTEETLIGLRALVKARSAAVGPVEAAETPEETRASVGASAAKATSGVQASQPRPATTFVKPFPVAPGAPTLPPPPVVTLPEGDKAARWAALHALIAADSVCSRMIPSGKRPALCAGGLNARVFFIGDAPGEEEETTGEPFAGAAGQLLGKMIGAMKLTPEQVCIGTILPWRPAVRSPGSEPVDRPVGADELTYGMAFMRAAIEIVQPEVLVVLGQDAAQGLLGMKFKSLAEVRGQWREFDGLPLMVTCKPSYLLRSNSNKTKRAAWEELLQVMERAGLPISDKQRGYFL